MATPQEPDDEPVGDELPEEVAEDLSADAEIPGDISAEDAIWRAIVDNYGDRPEIDEPPVEVPPSLRDLKPRDQPRDELAEEGAPESAPVEREEHFVPPEPPPLPLPPPARLLAWIGLFGVPSFVLVALVAKLNLSGWMGLLLMVWFVGGFVFLVASMRPGPGEDHDDGARL